MWRECVLWMPGFLIRIDLMRIRIQQFFSLWIPIWIQIRIRIQVSFVNLIVTFLGNFFFLPFFVLSWGPVKNNTLLFMRKNVKRYFDKYKKSSKFKCNLYTWIWIQQLTLMRIRIRIRKPWIVCSWRRASAARTWTWSTGRAARTSSRLRQTWSSSSSR